MFITVFDDEIQLPIYVLAALDYEISDQVLELEHGLYPAGTSTSYVRILCHCFQCDRRDLTYLFILF
jgi:hypothetical protein